MKIEVFEGIDGAGVQVQNNHNVFRTSLSRKNESMMIESLKKILLLIF